ncbi:hypothetical protein N7532_008371 [Penicillium argentinense]|uniref:Aminotransferase class I/classII large domain-containing protein n=1 Tax=Penicillium argentinense TaxID=1131581 RepID=A0A9W9K2F9_9EURO|nr:uncharacterized protein N7532_008371 [Penicillium argentinense]KAJ5089687.1 hypothetical protein N7532_008371 [Penicillium argentinense]
MVKINEFAVERWMDDYETGAKHNLAETCCASVSLDDLHTFSGQETDAIDSSRKQTYGAIRGSEALRSNISKLYSSNTSAPLSSKDILVANGAIQANFLAHYTHIGPGDHVICHYPTYQQLYSVPQSLGAEVALWKSSEDKDWQLDLSELKSLIQPNTKLIIINNPQNPTGVVLCREVLQKIVDIARQHDIIVHCDEVYRPLFHSLGNGSESPPSILDFGYEKAISTGSMSKAFSLAGIRLGWIASRSSEIIESCASVRHYTLISVGQLNDSIATRALSDSCVDNLLDRNIRLAQQNLHDLGIFVRDYEGKATWFHPRAGTTAFVKFMRNGTPIDDVAFCQQVLEKKGVLLAPGSRCFGEGNDFKGYVRVGYVPDRQVLVDGLQALRLFMEEDFENLPLAAV